MNLAGSLTAEGFVGSASFVRIIADRNMCFSVYPLSGSSAGVLDLVYRTGPSLQRIQALIGAHLKVHRPRKAGSDPDTLSVSGS